MNTLAKKITLVLAGLLTAMVASLTTGCASGGLRSSLVEVWQDERLLHTISLIETPEHKIQLLQDGVLKSEVDNIHSLPRISHFSKSGQILSQEMLPQTVIVTQK